MIFLGLNIDHCATVRQARYRVVHPGAEPAVEPDPVTLAVHAERAGADGITIHLREDRRHIIDSDVHRVRESIATRLNLEMACTSEMAKIAAEVKPDSVCLVPENRAEITTEGGLDVVGQRDRVAAIVDAMGAAGIAVSLFIDPDEPQIAMAAELGAPFIELHTGAWANRFYDAESRAEEFARLVRGAGQGHALGLTVNAGHGINYLNVAEIRTLPHLHECNIGHSIISRALFTGIDEAVREMRARLND
ncbi:pyridoxine 5'-phosphate synthase [Synoicihabitans lomoniglobus]|uniref:Pyridoxine 5'-phosphate synthase n=1 Tax=Synoicihabitans lomoniglobus TaxID=2909285 RepID=A0AAF0A1C3_9BACT|nr:pyridoxine 5'-phosphate synthase [Opitutaceae bacterium LMO-M01]WED65653.1 pyridoxine 5'-phosphate synthase [Opitutaceae bacterium LMO-M01]